MDPIAHLAGCCYLNHPTEGEEPGHWGVTGKHLTEKQSGNALFKIVHVGSECLFILVLVLDVLVTSLRHKQEGHGGPFKDQIAKKTSKNTWWKEHATHSMGPSYFSFCAGGFW